MTPLPKSKDELIKALFRDQLIINTNIYPDIREGEQAWAEKLGCVRPNYNVIAATPDSNFSRFAIWTEEDAYTLRTRGAVLLSPQLNTNIELNSDISSIDNSDKNRIDYIIIDEIRYPNWLSTAEKLATQEGVPDANLVNVAHLTRKWLADTGWSIQPDDVLAAFDRDGFAVIRQVEVLHHASYAPETLAKHAVDATIDDAEQLFNRSSQDLYQSKNISARELSRLRSIAVLDLLEGLTPKERNRQFFEAFQRSPVGQNNSEAFNRLKCDRPDVFAKVLEEKWQSRRIDLKERATIEHEMSSITVIEKKSDHRRFWTPLRKIMFWMRSFR